MTSTFRHLALALAASLAAPIAAAGTVTVSYDAQGTYTDAGTTPTEREQRLAELAAHLKALGEKRLGPDRTLSVELIDLDLTGTLRPSRHPSGDVRVVQSRADGPRIELRYVLRDATKEIAAGRETLHNASLPRIDRPQDATGADPLRHEKKLLDEWFEARFGRAQ